MKFLTPYELARHLRTLVDDEDFIARTVQVHFPEYKKQVRQAEREHAKILLREIRERRARTKAEKDKAVANEPNSYVATGENAAEALRMEQTSHALLKALWAHHSPILHTLQERYGRTVVNPWEGA